MLEVSIEETYKKEDLERVFLFVNALLNNKDTQIVFSIHPFHMDLFQTMVSLPFCRPQYQFNIKEKTIQ